MELPVAVTCVTWAATAGWTMVYNRIASVQRVPGEIGVRCKSRVMSSSARTVDGVRRMDSAIVLMGMAGIIARSR